MLKKCDISANPTIIRYAQTPLGKLLLILLFALILFQVNTYPGPWQQVIVITIIGTTFIPRFRYLWLFIGMLVLLMQNFLIKPELDWENFILNYMYQVFKQGYQNYLTPMQIKYIDIFLMLVLSEIFIFIICRYRQYRITKYPITISYAFLIALIVIAARAPLPRIEVCLLWSFIAVYNHYFWFVGYTMIESPLSRNRNFMLDYARYLPVWGFTALPYGKGSVYLKHVEAKTSEDLAVTQLKGLKLVIWAFILYLALHVMYRAYDYFDIPKLIVARHDYTNGQYYTVARAWITLWGTLFRRMLELTVMGHFVVSVCRMCGFRILRNTYKPLQADTIAEYWNRYNFYFKELLVIFFFYPAFFRFFKDMPRTRMFFATMSAACFGNILFHFLLLTPIIMEYGISEACRGMLQFVFYAFILGLSIGISQLHNVDRKKSDNKFKKYIMSPLIVLVFYSILGSFSNPYQSESIMVNFKFVASLFNITW